MSSTLHFFALWLIVAAIVAPIIGAIISTMGVDKDEA